MEDKLLQIPVYSIGLRPSLVLGCDRRTILTLGLLLFVMVFAWDFYWTVDLICVALWFAALALLRAAAKADPQHMDVFKRYRVIVLTFFRRNRLLFANRNIDIVKE
ncbi:VirB3 family type IV secretion system protein [Succinatimonas hippei]|uniref:VirB3 family type IV secretion system protein n=1 Tax=Succinatimonas hippei TaxID=626938 RepID=UPI0023F7A44F|nr:VirB3 family type IV secretion system protein [Succinatimonas hippei]